ncbi:MAG: hypothetical protein A3G25_00825 [Betaproteobacteria bacterium RIFCSPLOWO2_12_FULL_63_13]|nr:MAG: hypothetical protein A3G25_00825 [Betaproteobacteria bacterium RIFCSPLOWO2_12_FULL_63_13]
MQLSLPPGAHAVEIAVRLDAQHPSPAAYQLRRIVRDALADARGDERVAAGIDQRGAELGGEEVEPVVGRGLAGRRRDGACQW